MKIFVTGLCTLHWGRLQYGNIGNYYIVEPLFRELHRVFKDAEIVTTFQMTQEFVGQECITVLPMDLYYSWKDDDLNIAKAEYESVKKQSYHNIFDDTTDYIKIVKECDVVINVSGDMWGDNAEHVGKNRFFVDLYKMRTAQLLGKKTVLFGGTPGPFTDDSTLDFAKEVFKNFTLVINREPTSTTNLIKWDFFMGNVKNFACPAFLFERSCDEEVDKVIESENILNKDNSPFIGFTIGGFNLPIGPYDMWPRDDEQYQVFVEAIEHIVEKTNARVLLISHTNGFELPPNFKLINGRDYQILKQLQEIVLKRGKVKPSQLLCVENPHLPKVTKTIIGRCEMFVTGRVHASVAAISQFVPTVFLNYEANFIPSTKMHGFASLVNLQNYVCEPGNREDIIRKIDECWNNKELIREQLKQNIPSVKNLSKSAFDAVKAIVQE